MSSAEAKTKKPNLSKDLLEQEGIYFYERVHTNNELPDWLRPVKEHLLRFRGMLPREMEAAFKEELAEYHESNPPAADWSLQPSDHEGDSVYMPERRLGEDKPRKSIIAELKKCEDIRGAAIKLEHAREGPWVDLLHEDVFRAFGKVFPQASTYDKTHHRWELHRDLHWNEFSNHGTSDFLISKRTGPKPDLTYAFPIIDTPKALTAGQFDPQVIGFSLEILNQLRNSKRIKLRSAPTTALRRYNDKGSLILGAADLICFPWAVMEAKSSNQMRSREVFCYCQAANASAEALTLRENLAKEARYTTREQDALVIFAFTCIGPDVKLWVTYREAGSQDVVMRCIWATSLKLIWGVLVLRMIVQNMRDWVYMRVKGEIAKQVLKVYRKLSASNVLSPDGDVIEQRRRPASSCGLAPVTPARIPCPHHPHSAPACVGQRSYGNHNDSPSSRRKDRYVIDDFIDDVGVDDDDWDDGYLSSNESSCSSSDTDGYTDDDVIDDEDEVQDLVRQTKEWFPDIGDRPDMAQIYSQYDSSASGNASEEDNQTDGDSDDAYFIEGERVTSARKFLVVESLQEKDRSKPRRRSHS